MALGEHALSITVASSFLRDWLRSYFSDELATCCEAVTGRPLPVRFQIDATLEEQTTSMEPEPAKKPRRLQDGQGTLRGASEAPPKPATPKKTSTPWTFQSFVVGPSNEFAHLSAQMMARGTCQASPLVLSGPPGVGKTHLLQAVRQEFQRSFPRSQAVYFTAERFTHEYVTALRGGSLPSFRQKCRCVALLLIDDIHFFAGKKATLEELQYTIDAAMADGRRLMLTSDRSLADLAPLGREIVSRLSSGMSCELRTPEYETRMGILRILAGQMGLELGEDVVQVVAGRLEGDARELRGALNRLQLVSLASGQAISRELAEETLDVFVRQAVNTVRLPDVERAICDVFGLEPALLRSARKARSVREPRMLAMWLARKHTGAAWSEIGEFFGRRSHSTVIAAHRRVEGMRNESAKVELENRPCAVDEAIRRVEAALRSA
jgi:chromosomal replication initiator protein